MLKLPTLEAGIYQHYKGSLYQVLGYAHDANDSTRIVVVYFGLQLDDAHRGPRLAVRTWQDFHATVCGEGRCTHFGMDREDIVESYQEEFVPRGTCTSAHLTQRFRYLRPEY